MKFGEMIRKLRKEQGMSLGQVAKLAGFSRTHLADIESGRREITMASAISLAMALGADDRNFLKVAILERLVKLVGDDVYGVTVTHKG